MPADLPNHFLTLMEQAFVGQLNQGFKLMMHYAMGLFYLIATIEIVVFAIFWALKGGDVLSQFILKIIKLSVIFMVISWYPDLLQILINGFSDVAFAIGGHAQKGAHFIFEPDHLWRLGFQNAMALLQSAVKYGTLNTAMSTLYDVLGFGLLSLFALIAAQVLVCIVGFYLVALIALLLIPLGGLSSTTRLFEKAIAQVFTAGARVFTIIVILCIAAGIWGQLPMGQATAGSSTGAIDLSHTLVFFFATLVICVLCYTLPRFVAQTIGEFRGDGFNVTPQPIITVTAPTVAAPSITPAIPTHATTAMGPGATGTGNTNNPTLPTASTQSPAQSNSPLAAASTVSSSSSSSAPMGTKAPKLKVNVSLSERAIKQLQRGLGKNKGK